MPAPLHASHKYLQDDCTYCHTMNKGVSEDRCPSCHKLDMLIKLGKLNGFGKHHKYDTEPALHCLECHTEHKGEHGSLLKKGKEFEKIPCGTCHEQQMGKNYKYEYERANKPKPKLHLKPSLHAKHQKWKNKCKVCHEAKLDSTKEQLRWKCTNCHDYNFKGFARHHTYANLDCIKCHTEHKGKEASLIKADATRLLSNCGQCHEQDMGKGYTYKLAEGPLRFDHALPSIHKKHEKWKSDCKNCHDKGILIYRCTNCHDPDTNELHVFEGFAKHHTYTELKCLECHTEHKGGEGTTTTEMDFTKIDCGQCHAREMGSQYKYTMITSKHPQNSIHKDHQKWRECDNCHQRGTPNEKCINCHDPKTGKMHVFKKFAQHHTDPKLDCLKCHTEHKGRSPESLLKHGADFDKINCSECHHAAEMKKDINISDLPKNLVGNATSFSHKQHPISDNIPSCELCHKHQKGKHIFEKYSRNCTNCHHVDQKISCEKCHTESNKFYKGIVPDTLIEGRPDRMSKVVKCEMCHAFDDTKEAFENVKDKCVECHTEDYGDLADYWKNYIQSEVNKLRNELTKIKKSETYPDYIASIERNLELVRTQGMHNWEVSNVLIKKLRAQIRSIVK